MRFGLVLVLVLGNSGIPVTVQGCYWKLCGDELE